MRKSTRTLDIVFVVGFGLLAMAVVGVSTPSSAGPYDALMTHETVVVMAVDHAKRTATLKNADGETKIVQVPAEVKSFDTLKVGDKIDIDYYESMAVKVLPKGSKPSMSETSSVQPMGAPGGTGTGVRETTVSAEIVSIDAKANKITFKGPQGNIRTVAVQDPDLQKKLPSLKVGQVVQLTYSEAMAASIRKPEAAPMREQQPMKDQQPMKERQ